MELTTEQLKARIAELEQQVAELSTYKNRYEYIKVLGGCLFVPLDDGRFLFEQVYHSNWVDTLGIANSEDEAIDAAFSGQDINAILEQEQEQEHE